MTPLERVIGALEQHGCRGRGTSWQCPAHEDQHQSLSIGDGKDEKVVIKCHAGCATEDIVKALSLEMKDLFPEREEPAPKRKPKVVATYQYMDENGVLLFEKLRFHPKKFLQRRPDPKGKDGWSWSLDGVRKVLYGLPGVTATVKDEKVVYFTEGEKAPTPWRRSGSAPRVDQTALGSGTTATPSPSAARTSSSCPTRTSPAGSTGNSSRSPSTASRHR
ncbi:MAG: hypothetical protein IPP07_15045 [Holophagales bacterium]|nr:hypothetical protein [Holophagales bacterium]